MKAEDFAHLATLIRENIDPGDDDSVLLSIPSANTILAALDIASIGLAAIAYHDRNDTLDNAMVEAWTVLQGEIEKWKGRQA